MRRTSWVVLLLLALFGTVAGFLVDVGLTAAGRPTFTPVLSLPILFVVLAAAYFVMNHIFYGSGVVSIIIELVGGTLFLIVILKKGRL